MHFAVSSRASMAILSLFSIYLRRGASQGE